MAKIGADPDRRSLFNFYCLKKAIEGRVSVSEGAERMFLENGQKVGLKQLVRQFQEQQYDADLQLFIILKPTKLIAIKLA